MSAIVYNLLVFEAPPSRHFLRPFPTVPEQEVRQRSEEVSARALAADGVGLVNVDLQRKLRHTNVTACNGTIRVLQAIYIYNYSVFEQ